MVTVVFGSILIPLGATGKSGRFNKESHVVYLYFMHYDASSTRNESIDNLEDDLSNRVSILISQTMVLITLTRHTTVQLTFNFQQTPGQE